VCYLGWLSSIFYSCPVAAHSIHTGSCNMIPIGVRFKLLEQSHGISLSPSVNSMDFSLLPNKQL
jgi:hypothetical protein